MDLEMAPNGEFYFMGISGYYDFNAPGTYPEQAAWGHYQRAPLTYMPCSYQTEVTMHRFASNRSLVWASLYGAAEPTTGDVTNDQINHLTHGSDYGHDMALKPGVVLYWVGTTGTLGFEDHCPLPGTSYCETQPAMFGVDHFDGFVARIELAGLNVGLPDAPSLITDNLSLRPCADGDWLLLLNGEPLRNTQVAVFDAIGRVVRSAITTPTGHIELTDLASGHYTVQTLDQPCRAASFVALR